MGVYNTYQDAYARAKADAREFDRPMGLERAREYGREVWRVRMVPKRPEQRFGGDLRCQIVEPGE